MDKRDKIIGLSTGIIVFLLGIILLIFTFYLVYTVFRDPTLLENFRDLAPGTSGEFGQIVEILVYVIAVLLLWVLGSVAGRIAKHGIDLFKPSKENILRLESPEQLTGSSREDEILAKINRIGKTVEGQNDMIKKMYYHEDKSPEELEKEIDEELKEFEELEKKEKSKK